LTEPQEFLDFLSEVLQSGVSFTIGLTSRGDSMGVQFYDGADRNQWYIHNRDGWDAMVVRLSVDRD
jgi:hypothetical protein